MVSRSQLQKVLYFAIRKKRPRVLLAKIKEVIFVFGNKHIVSIWGLQGIRTAAF